MIGQTFECKTHTLKCEFMYECAITIEKMFDHKYGTCDNNVQPYTFTFKHVLFSIEQTYPCTSECISLYVRANDNPTFELSSTIQTLHLKKVQAYFQTVQMSNFSCSNFHWWTLAFKIQTSRFKRSNECTCELI